MMQNKLLDYIEKSCVESLDLEITEDAHDLTERYVKQVLEDLGIDFFKSFTRDQLTELLYSTVRTGYFIKDFEIKQGLDQILNK